MLGTHLGAYLNDVPMITLTDSTCSSGSVAVGSQGATFEADDVRVVEPAPYGTPWFAGFEDPARPWTTTGVGTIAVTTTDKTEGARSLAVSGCGYTMIFSPLFNTNEFPIVGTNIAFDIKLPTAQDNPYWYGQAQIFATIPGPALNNVPFEAKLNDTEPLRHWRKFLGYLGCRRGLQLVSKPGWFRKHSEDAMDLVVASAGDALVYFV